MQRGHGGEEGLHVTTFGSPDALRGSPQEQRARALLPGHGVGHEERRVPHVLSGCPGWEGAPWHRVAKASSLWSAGSRL